MTDLEMTRLCAKAMGGIYRVDENDCLWTRNYASGWSAYRPLHDDEQAMALVKKLRLKIEYQGLPSGANWHVASSMYCCNADLNRAIVECVAKMQSSVH